MSFLPRIRRVGLRLSAASRHVSRILRLRSGMGRSFPARNQSIPRVRQAEAWGPSESAPQRRVSAEAAAPNAFPRIAACGRGRPARAGVSHASRASVTDSDVPSLDDHRHLPLTAGQVQHPIQLFGLLFDIDVTVVLVGLPGAAGVRSPRLAVDHDRFRHGLPPLGAPAPRTGPRSDRNTSERRVKIVSDGNGMVRLFAGEVCGMCPARSIPDRLRYQGTRQPGKRQPKQRVFPPAGGRGGGEASAVRMETGRKPGAAESRIRFGILDPPPAGILRRLR